MSAPEATAPPPPADALAVRAHLVRALRAELTGPHAETELLPQPPQLWYHTGFLVPKGTPYGAGVQLELLDALADNAPQGPLDDDAAADDGKPPKVPPRLPSTFGLSAVVPPGPEHLWADLRWGAYHKLSADEVQAIRLQMQHNGQQQQLSEADAEEAQADALDEGPDPDDPEAALPLQATETTTETADKPKGASWWRRRTEAALNLPLPLKPGVHAYPVTGRPHLTFTVRVVPAGTAWGLPTGSRVVSVFVGNHHPDAQGEAHTAATLFQAELRLHCPEGFVPRRSDARLNSTEPDLRRADLQYRHHAEWAVGHNVSAAAQVEGQGGAARCTHVATEWLPTATVYRMKAEANFAIELGMEALGALPDAAAVQHALRNLPTEFRAWIAAREAEAATFEPPRRRAVAEVLAEDAALACNRIEAGLALLASDPDVFFAFRLANQAMAAAARQARPFKAGTGPSWRLFQLAFLLLNLRGVAQPEHSDRQAVDLLFFPTGGGKTEAYLGVAAFTMLLRRLRNQGQPHRGAGVAVLLRYTLRLLTLDQLQRAATLSCALDLLRRAHPELGPHPFSVGLWVGSKATPNRLTDARQQKQRHWAQPTNPLHPLPCPLTACPWCATPFDVDSLDFEGPAKTPTAMRIYCANLGGVDANGIATPPCPFTADAAPGVGVPLHVVDEQIYTAAPTFLVGTVDKFAALPWRGASGALFGRVRGASADGTQFVPRSSTERAEVPYAEPGLPPPDLIIQDELHLITGPLGTVMSLYEVAIEALCRDAQGHGPKILASTATARRADQQVKALFGRGHTPIFPPPGPDPDATFFSQVDRDPQKSRLYVGVAAPGRNLNATLVRTWSTLMGAVWHQWAAGEADPEVAAGRRRNPADPYCSLVGYFNNLRELGATNRTVSEQVSPRVSQLERRRPLDAPTSPLFRRRYIAFEVDELTSRLSSDKIRRTGDRYRAPYNPRTPADVLLASSMISVGVDIPRLGLMCVTGQPRTVSEYIQATSRVGREYPGLVVTLHNLYRPRDRSHFERFTPFHEAFYREVEAAGVTPFSGRALDRALVGAALGYARHRWPGLSAPRGAQGSAGVANLAESLVSVFEARIRTLTTDKAEADRLVDAVGGRLRSLVSAWGDLAAAQQQATTGLQWSHWEGSSPPALLRELDAPDDVRSAAFNRFRAPTSLRDVEPTVHLWVNRTPPKDEA